MDETIIIIKEADVDTEITINTTVVKTMEVILEVVVHHFRAIVEIKTAAIAGVRVVTSIYRDIKEDIMLVATITNIREEDIIIIITKISIIIKEITLGMETKRVMGTIKVIMGDMGVETMDIMAIMVATKAGAIITTMVSMVEDQEDKIMATITILTNNKCNNILIIITTT